MTADVLVAAHGDSNLALVMDISFPTADSR